MSMADTPKKNLSPTMHRAIGYANRFGGKLTRWQGGFWCGPKTLDMRGSMGTSTIEALVARGVGSYTQWAERPWGKFPIEFTLDEFYKPKEAHHG